MKIVLAVSFFLATFFLSDGLRLNQELLSVIIATILGFTLGKLIDLQSDFKALRNILANDKLARLKAERKLAQEKAVSSSSIEESRYEPSQSNQVLSQNRITESGQVEGIDIESESFELIQNYQAGVAEDITSPKGAIPKKTQNEALPITETSIPSFKEGFGTDNHERNSVFDKAIDTITGYFTGGNLFVRIGIVILFFGVSFLLKYVSDQGLFPIEYRLISVVIGAIALLGLGWHYVLKTRLMHYFCKVPVLGFCI